MNWRTARRLVPVALRASARVLSAAAEAWDVACLELLGHQGLVDGQPLGSVEDVAAMADMAERSVVQADAPRRVPLTQRVEETVDQMWERFSTWPDRNQPDKPD